MDEQLAKLRVQLDQINRKAQNQPASNHSGLDQVIHEMGDSIDALDVVIASLRAENRVLLDSCDDRDTKLEDLARFPDENPGIVLRLNSKGEIIYANPVCRKVLDNYAAISNSTALPAWFQQLRQGIQHPGNSTIEVWIGEQWFSFLVVPVPERGYINYYGRDATDRKRAEELVVRKVVEAETAAQEAQSQADEIEAIFTQLTDGVLIYNQDGIPVRVNSMVISVYGFDPTGMLPPEMARLIQMTHLDGTPWRPEEFVVYRALQGETVHDTRLKMVPRDGKTMLLSISGNPIRNQKGEITGAAVIFHDITEQQRLETENLRQKALLDGIFESDPSGLAVVVGPELRFAYLNPAYRYVTPDPMLDPIDQPYSRVWPPKSRYWYRDRFLEVLTTGKPFQVTGIEHRFPDGSVRSYTVQARRITWENQFAVLLAMWDTTEILRTAHELRESEQRLKAAQEMAHVGSWELDLQTNRLTWSDEIYRIFGLTPRQFGASYEAFLDSVHPDDRAAVDAAYTSSLREGMDCYEIEHRVVRKSTGEVRFVHEKCDHIRDETGRIVRSIGMVQDITERKQTEQALRESEQKFMAIFQNSPFAISLTRRMDGTVVDVNQAALDLFEYKWEEVIGHTSVELRVLQDIPTRERLVAELTQKRTVRNHETVYQTSNGETRYISINLDPLTIRGKDYLLSTIENITARILAEKEQANLLAQIETQRQIAEKKLTDKGC